MGPRGAFTAHLKDPRRVCRDVWLFKEYVGKRVQIDGFVWLHSIATKYPIEFVLDNNHAPIIKDYVQLQAWLQGMGILTLSVFDGAGVLAKGVEAEKRARKRAESMATAELLAQEDDVCEAEIEKHCKIAIKIGWPLVLGTVSALRAAGLAVQVAPYEADSQILSDFTSLSLRCLLSLL